jgi:peptidoglycan/xylan/chitin deacetylase (PgdA/CDA1 family)
LGFKRTVRNSAGFILAATLILLGCVRRARERAFQKDVITAIAFHNPDGKLFRKIVFWLQRHGYVFLSPERLINILKKRDTCPSGAVWISLDDGWQGNMDSVIPIAVQHNIPVTIFVCTGAVEEGAFWWRKVRQSPNVMPAEFRNGKSILEQPECVRKQIISLIDQTGLQFRREAMTVAEIKSLATIPQVTLGAHTATHPVLPNCPDDQIEYELAESKGRLEEWTGKGVTAFAYPNGSFDGRERRFLEAHGYELAATTENGPAEADGDAYLFPRNIVMDDGSFAENLCHALGIWDPMVTKLKRLVRQRGHTHLPPRQSQLEKILPMT